MDHRFIVNRNFIVVAFFLAICLICGLSWMIRASASTTAPTPAQVVATPQIIPPTPTPVVIIATPLPTAAPKPAAGPAAGSASVTMTRLPVTQLQAWINQVASDQYADSLSLLIGGFCDTNVTTCVSSQTGNWTVTGPATISTDPGHLALQGGVRVIKTYQFRKDWIFGVYYCPPGATCTIPTPGRAAFLDAALPESLLH